MSLLSLLLQGYAITLLIYIQLSLLVCTPSLCLFGTHWSNTGPLLPSSALNILQKSYFFLPFAIDQIQILSIFLFISEIIMIIIQILRMLSNFIKCIAISALITLTIMLAIYLTTTLPTVSHFNQLLEQFKSIISSLPFNIPSFHPKEQM